MSKMPHVKNVLQDERRNITYEIMAYRSLSKPELITAVRVFRSTKQGRKVKNNTLYRIYSIIGGNDPL